MYIGSQPKGSTGIPSKTNKIGGRTFLISHRNSHDDRFSLALFWENRL
jgi:hypothetical protein